MSLFGGLPDLFVSTFGEAVTITPTWGPPRVITAVYRREVDRDSAFDRSGQIHDVRLAAREADVQDITDGARVTARGVEYLTGAPAFDGRGMAVLDLRLA